MTRVRPRRLVAAAALVLAAAGVAAAVELLPAALSGRPKMVLGVLAADPHYLRADTAAGIRLAMLNVSWSQWEPRQGAVSTAYRTQIRAEVAAYHRAGWEVAIDPGFQSPPGWVFGLPGGQLLDQHRQPAATPDYEFSRAVRAQAAAYLTALVHDLGPVQYYRVGLNEHGEAHYPDTGTGQWWIGSPAAQGAAASELPAGVPVTPMPGWVPGQPTWHGRAVTVAAATRWYDWYFGAMVNALTWEIHTYRRAGYSGTLQLVVPGYGALPGLYRQALDGRLAPLPRDGVFTINTGAVWWKLLDELPLHGLALDISSVYDHSGNPREAACRSHDARVPITSPAVGGWSDTRWLTSLARRHHMTVMGENPGNTPPSSVAPTLALARSCGLVALMWAWDDQLHSGGQLASLGQLAVAYHQVVRAAPGDRTQVGAA